MQARTVLPKSKHGFWLLALAALGVVGLATAAVVRFGPLSGSPTADETVRTGLAYFAFDDTADTLYIADPDRPAHRTKVFVAPHAAEYGVVPSLSPDGKRLVYTSLAPETQAASPATPAALWLKTLSDGDAPRLIAKDVDLLVHPAWSPDGANVVYRRSQGTKGALFVLDVSKGSERTLVSDDKAGLFPIGFSRSGENLYYTTVLTDGSDLYSIPLAGGTPNLVAHLADSLTRDWALSPDKTKLAYLQMNFDDGRVASKALLLDLTSTAISSVSDEQDDAFSPTWGADGRLVVGTLGEKGAAVVTLNGPRIESPAAGFDVPLLVRDQGIVVQGFSGGSATNPGTSTLTYVATDGTRRTIADGEVTFLGLGSAMIKLLRRVCLAFFGLLLLAPFLIQSPVHVAADSCAFPFKPTAYEDLKNRQLYLNTIELASYNMLFPGDKDFGVPDLKVGPRNARTTMPGTVPPVLMKAIAWIESSLTQGDGTAPFGSIGPALVSFDCGSGISQVTTGMTLPNGEDGRGSPAQALVATNYAYNVARGTWILADKWNGGGEKLPIAGSDTNGFPMILENWYFAVWAYNGFTGPGASRSNHPLDPIYGSWPRQPYSCGPTADGKGHNRSNYPYQELVYGCVLNPPVVDGKYLWQAQSITFPDLNNPQVKSALSMSNFVFPYTRMDIPSPQPAHADNTPKPDASLRAKVLGNPKMSLSDTTAHIGYDPSSGSTVDVVDINNDGTGVLTWYATSSVPWLQVLPYTGVAVGSDLSCSADSVTAATVASDPAGAALALKTCDRVGHLQLVVDSTKAPAGRNTATVTVQALGSSQTQTIAVDVTQVVRLSAPGISRGSTSR